MKDVKYKITGEESPRTHFTQIPNSVIDNPDLSHTALRLYLWYRRVCWDGGACYQSLTTICKATSMRRSTAVAARRKLKTAGLIRVQSKLTQTGRRVSVTIVDIWCDNAAYYQAESTGSASPIGIPGRSDPDTVERKKEDTRKDQKKEVCTATKKDAVPIATNPTEFYFPVRGKGKKEWSLPHLKMTEYLEAFPDIDIPAELRTARQWCRDNPTKRKTASGMLAFITRWLSREQNNGGARRNGNNGHNNNGSNQPALERMMEKFDEQIAACERAET